MDVGESYGSPRGRAAFSALYSELVERRGFSRNPCLLARSRGGLMLYNWAAEHPESVAGIAGIAKAQIGNLVGPGNVDELTTVSTVDPIKVWVPISEQEFLAAQRLFQLRKHLGVELVVGSATLALAEGVTHDLDDADTVLDVSDKVRVERRLAREHERMRTTLAALETARVDLQRARVELEKSGTEAKQLQDELSATTAAKQQSEQVLGKLRADLAAGRGLPRPLLAAHGKLTAADDEVAANPRARSAVMRVAERTAVALPEGRH